ncbi:MAG: hypothetical protein NTZ00_02100, partial [Bacteroidetes bacterium]|nr:hypothetical protein [Bacteroidota bacterium]
MKNLFTYLGIAALLFLAGPTTTNSAKGQALAISEIFVNPAGTDSCKEFVELVATKSINFATSDIKFAGAKDTTQPTYVVSIANNDTTVLIESKIQLLFSEKIRLSAGANCDNNNIDTLFTLKETDASGAKVS